MSTGGADGRLPVVTGGGDGRLLVTADGDGGGRLLVAAVDVDDTSLAAEAAAEAADLSATTIFLVFTMRLLCVSESVELSAVLFLGFRGQRW